MFWWLVEYAFGGHEPIIKLGGMSDSDWHALPVEGVVRVHVQHGPYRHTLAGFDNYWVEVSSRKFGVFNDPENRGWYPGAMALAFVWPQPELEVPVSNPDVPPGAHVLRGVMLDDALARKVGLLGPNDSSPPRPT